MLAGLMGSAQAHTRTPGESTARLLFMSAVSSWNGLFNIIPSFSEHLRRSLCDATCATLPKKHPSSINTPDRSRIPQMNYFLVA
jgi:hypothetical protein